MFNFILRAVNFIHLLLEFTLNIILFILNYHLLITYTVQFIIYLFR